MEEEKNGCVYFFRHLGLPPVKIGYSNHPSPIKRFEQFKTYAPFGCELLGFISSEEAKSLEKTLHFKFKDKRLKGEWFDITKKDVESEIEYYSSTLDLKEKSIFWEQFAKSIFNKNLKDENLESQVGNDLIKFLDEKNIIGKRIERKSLKTEFQLTSKDYLTSQEFNNKIRKYCILKQIILKEVKFNGFFHFCFDFYF